MPAVDSTHPLPTTVTTTTVPAATDRPAIAAPPRVMLERAPSLPRSSTHTVPFAAACTATTVSIAAPETSTTGAATDTATGNIDKALASEALGCALAVPARCSDITTHEMTCFIVRVLVVFIAGLSVCLNKIRGITDDEEGAS